MQVEHVGRTRTLPTGATPRLRLAVLSCPNHAAGFFNAYRRVAERADLDAVLHLGDYLYGYGPNGMPIRPADRSDLRQNQRAFKFGDQLGVGSFDPSLSLRRSRALTATVTATVATVARSADPVSSRS